jgi:hypothetical protein
MWNIFKIQLVLLISVYREKQECERINNICFHSIGETKDEQKKCIYGSG